MHSPFRPAFLFACALFTLLSFSGAAHASSFKLKSTDIQEGSGAWHVFVTIELNKAPSTAQWAVLGGLKNFVAMAQSLKNGIKLSPRTASHRQYRFSAQILPEIYLS